MQDTCIRVLASSIGEQARHANVLAAEPASRGTYGVSSGLFREVIFSIQLRKMS